MKNKLLTSVFVIALAIMPIVSSADSTLASTTMKIRDIRAKAQADLEARRKELEQKREDFQSQKENFKSEMEQKKEDIRNEVEQKKDDIKSQMEERKANAVQAVKDRLDKFTKNIVERFDAAIERLSKIADRLDSRIAKMESESIDVSQAKDLMIVARVKIETAKTSISEISLDSETISSSTATTTAEVKANFDILRSTIEKAKNDVKAVRAALTDVINSLKPGLNKLNKNATSTESTSTSEDN